MNVTLKGYTVLILACLLSSTRPDRVLPLQSLCWYRYVAKHLVCQMLGLSFRLCTAWVCTRWLGTSSVQLTSPMLLSKPDQNMTGFRDIFVSARRIKHPVYFRLVARAFVMSICHGRWSHSIRAITTIENRSLDHCETSRVHWSLCYRRAMLKDSEMVVVCSVVSTSRNWPWSLVDAIRAGIQLVKVEIQVKQ